MTRLIAISLLSLLVACGGGGSDEEPGARTPRVDCQARPEQCR